VWVRDKRSHCGEIRRVARGIGGEASDRPIYSRWRVRGVMELLHPCLNVTDMDRAVAFYTEELDFTESWSFESPDGKTENRYLAAENGVELQLSKTEGVDELEQGTAWDHFAVSRSEEHTAEL